MITKVFALMYGAKFPRVEQGNSPRHACLDGFNPVIFELEKIKRIKKEDRDNHTSHLVFNRSYAAQERGQVSIIAPPTIMPNLT